MIKHVEYRHSSSKADNLQEKNAVITDGNQDPLETRNSKETSEEKFVEVGSPPSSFPPTFKYVVNDDNAKQHEMAHFDKKHKMPPKMLALVTEWANQNCSQIFEAKPTKICQNVENFEIENQTEVTAKENNVPINEDPESIGIEEPVDENESFQFETNNTGNRPISTDNRMFVKQTVIGPKSNSLEPENCLKSHEMIPIGKKSYKCVICALANCQNLKHHEKVHTGEKNHQCSNCDKKFVHSKSLKYHLRIHAGEKPYKCESCDEIFGDSKSFKVHERIHTGEKPYECGSCDKKFTQWSGLKSHEKTHTGEKPNTCDICDKTFSQSSNLSRHKKLHTDGKPFGSGMFNKQFENDPSPKAHEGNKVSEKLPITKSPKMTYEFSKFLEEKDIKMEEDCSELEIDDSTKSSSMENENKTHHTTENTMANSEKPYNCYYCDKKFGLRQVHDTHVMIHTGEKPYKCSICDKKFTQPGNLKSHKKIHTGDKPYECGSCGLIFAHSQNLKRHERTHTGEKPYKCGICDKMFTQSGSLKLHERTHTGEKSYTCGICHKNFSQSSNLSRHKRSHTDGKPFHTGEKPYECNICDKKFTQPGNLKLHEKTHTEENSYTCDICDKNFSHPSNLSRHKKLHTDEKPFAYVMFKEQFKDDPSRKAHESNKVCEKPSITESPKMANKPSQLLEEKDIKIEEECSELERVNSRKSISMENTMKNTVPYSEKPYNCGYCDKKFRLKKFLNRHKMIHTGEKPYECGNCDKKFIRSQTLKEHERTHTGEKPYKCCICDKKFTHHSNFRRHEKSKVCEKADGNKDPLEIRNSVETSEEMIEGVTSPHYVANDDNGKDHEIIHFDKQHKMPPKMLTLVTEWANQNCSQTFEPKPTKKCNNVENIKIENQTEVTTREINQYSESIGIEEPVRNEVKFKNISPEKGQGEIALHKFEEHEKFVSNRPSNIHLGRKSYECGICNKKFQQSKLKEHLRIHTGEKPFKCSICGQKFRRTQTLKTHKKAHSGEKPYKCDSCDKQFTRSENLRKHVRNKVCVNPLIKKCPKITNEPSKLLEEKDLKIEEECSKLEIVSSTKSSSMEIENITYYTTKNTVPYNEKPYNCAFCDKNFRLKKFLNRHKMFHTGIYKCGNCDKKFTRSQSLKEHKRTHTGEKPYECGNCDKKFTRSQSLKEHERTHTGEKPYKCGICDKKFTHHSNFRRHERSKVCEKPSIIKSPKMTNDLSKLLEEKDIKMEEEYSDLENTSDKSSRMEDKDNAYLNKKDPKPSNQRTYGERPNLSKGPRKAITNLQKIQSPPKKMLHNETVLTKNPKNNENSSDVAKIFVGNADRHNNQPLDSIDNETGKFGGREKENSMGKANFTTKEYFDLPYGWRKEVVSIKNQPSMKGKVREDIYLISPGSNGKRIKSAIKLQIFLEENPNIKCDLEVTSTSKLKHREFFMGQKNPINSNN